MNKPAVQSNHLANAFFCVSLNPAIDTRLVVNGFVPGRVNRVSEVHRTPGGKAAHVAMALKGLGATPTWIGFSGGATGGELLAGLRLLEIATMPVSTCKASRVNLEILDTSGEVTEVLEPGGTITQSEWSDFLQVCVGAFQLAADKKIAVISGSLPPGVPTEACATLIGLARSADCLAFVDSSGLPLSKALAAGPDLVSIGRKQSLSRRLPYGIPFPRRKPFASYSTWARTPPPSASAIAASSVCGNKINWQFTHVPLLCGEIPPSAAVIPRWLD